MSIFILIPEKGNAKECSNYRTTALISLASEIMLNQASIVCELRTSRCSSWIQKRQRKPQIKLPTSVGPQKKQENSRKTSTSFLLIRPNFDCVDHNKLSKILKEMGIPDHLTCLLRNLYPGQKATELDMKQQTGSKLGKEYVKAVYCLLAY